MFAVWQQYVTQLLSYDKLILLCKDEIDDMFDYQDQLTDSISRAYVH